MAATSFFTGAISTCFALLFLPLATFAQQEILPIDALAGDDPDETSSVGGDAYGAALDQEVGNEAT
jgi:hypothetical protein